MKKDGMNKTGMYDLYDMTQMPSKIYTEVASGTRFVADPRQWICSVLATYIYLSVTIYFHITVSIKFIVQ